MGRERETEKRCTAIVLAAGSGTRMQSKVAKQYMPLLGKPLICYALQAFEQSELIDDIILVAGKGEVSYCTREIVEKYHYAKVDTIVEGGAERYLSVWSALQVMRDDDMSVPNRDGYVFIHDGARPLLTGAIIEKVYDAVQAYHACVAGMPVKDTIKLADRGGFAVSTPERSLTWAVQTPQAFDTTLITAAYEKLMEQRTNLIIDQNSIQITDDAMVVETMLGHPIKLVEASYENMKITTPSDMQIAVQLLNSLN